MKIDKENSAGILMYAFMIGASVGMWQTNVFAGITAFTTIVLIISLR